MSSAATAASSSSSKTIITHSGSFHCDEALAVGMLRLTEAFRGAQVVRTRDPAVIATGDVVVDVGGEYDPERNLYDHHQRGFTETLSPEHKTKLSSAGLVYKHFGKQVVANVAQLSDPDTVDLIYAKMYTDFVEAVDAIDNGISQYPSDLVPAYKSNGTDLGSRVAALNPRWNETPAPPADDPDADPIQARFERAVAITTEAFVGKLEHIVYSWLPARDIVKATVAAAQDVHPSGAILKLESFCPWKSHLPELESEPGITKYVLFTDSSGMWRIQAVPVAPSSFESRLPLPEPWRGLRDAELDAVTEIPGGTFVHASGFIGGHKSYDGVLAMAVKALELDAAAAAAAAQ